MSNLSPENSKKKECKSCLNTEYFDPLTKRRIKISDDGLCDLCIQSIEQKADFLALKQKVKDDLSKNFEQIKKEKREYDAILWLSGGKDSSAALILAKEKYKLNILTLTVDKGNLFKQTKENIDDLTDTFGVDHIYFKVPNNIFQNLFKFGISIMGLVGICCQVCSSLMFRPITSHFLLKYDVPIIITGVDTWEIYGAYLDQKWRENKNKQVETYNQFFQYLPQFGHLLNDYNYFIDKILHQLNLFSKDTQNYEDLKNEFLQIIEPMKRWWLNQDEIQKFNIINKKIRYIPLPAIEFSKRSELLELLKKYNWKLPKLPTGEIIGTDCQVANLINAITGLKSKRKFWSYKIISGYVTKQDALNEIKEPINLQYLKEMMSTFKINKLENRLKLGWENPYYKDLYNLEVIDKLNES